MTKKQAKQLFSQYMTTLDGAVLFISRDDYNSIIDIIYKDMK